jgi:hypothetical protein
MQHERLFLCAIGFCFIWLKQFVNPENSMNDVNEAENVCTSLSGPYCLHTGSAPVVKNSITERFQEMKEQYELQQAKKYNRHTVIHPLRVNTRNRKQKQEEEEEEEEDDDDEMDQEQRGRGTGTSMTSASGNSQGSSTLVIQIPAERPSLMQVPPTKKCTFQRFSKSWMDNGGDENDLLSQSATNVEECENLCCRNPKCHSYTFWMGHTCFLRARGLIPRKDGNSFSANKMT